MVMQKSLQSAVQLVYPPRCLLCGGLTETDFGLCGPCWRDTPFIDGLVCDACGVPLPGEGDGVAETCDECRRVARPWDHGRAAMHYTDNGRRFVLGVKYGHRTDLARAAAKWLARAGGPLLADGALLVPVPLHFTRLFARRYNQSALLARYLAKETGLEHLPDGLKRVRRTRRLVGMTADERFATLADAIAPHPKRGVQLAGRDVILVDDVMTSGATAAAATEAARRAGATSVCVLHLARAAKDT